MIVKDLSNSFYPYPKNGSKIEIKKQEVKKKKTKNKQAKKQDKKELITDFCIMPKNNSYSTKRTRKYN